MNRDEALRALVTEQRLSGANLILARMWVYQRDMETQSRTYAEAKTYYERTRATLITTLTMADSEGKKLSVAAAEQNAEADPDVWKAALGYRLAEQMVTADKEALKILHAELEKWRTERADERAADSFTARTGT